MTLLVPSSNRALSHDNLRDEVNFRRQTDTSDAREEEWFLVDDVEEFWMKLGDKIIGAFIRSLTGYHS